MCGLFGVLAGKNNRWPQPLFLDVVKELFLLSEARGKEAAGLAICDRAAIRIHKDAIPGHEMINTSAYQRLMDNAYLRNQADPSPGLITPFSIIGHSRLVTDGRQGLDRNNQPVSRENVVLVHNGIVVNHAALWQSMPHLTRTCDVDTEIMAAMLADCLKQQQSVVDAVRFVFQRIEGESSIAVNFTDIEMLLLATNTGSLYTWTAADQSSLIFASERYILEQMQQQSLRERVGTIQHVRPGTAHLINLHTLAVTACSLLDTPTADVPPSIQIVPSLAANRRIEDRIEQDHQARQAMRRCTQCVLPETMPFIWFNQDGVCNYCLNYQPTTLLPEGDLEQILARHRKGNGELDCIVAFSGGRDSSYGLHLLKNRYGMTPLAYTYDWGMVTDLGRRNQARMCGRLGIEHIWVSADIRAKRDNVRRNIEAWMKQPDLGIIPLFMAGDKQFFYYANQVMKQTRIPLIIFCTNRLEKTDFKTGFCGIRPDMDNERPNALNSGQKYGLLGYYASQFIKNPAYLNRSIPDTLTAYLSYYMMKRDFTHLFDYTPWDEAEIDRVLINDYHWELATDTDVTWRIGDATAPFYNYIYYSVAGFTEHDTFRSNQVREGILTRDEAWRLVEKENQPRWPSLQEYARMLRIDLDEFLRVVNRMPRLYVKN